MDVLDFSNRWIVGDLLGEINGFSFKLKKYWKLAILGYPSPDLPRVLMTTYIFLVIGIYDS